MSIPPPIVQNADMLAAAATSTTASIALTASQIAPPGDWWALLSYVPAVLGPVAVAVVNRWLAARAARKAARAKFLAAEAERLLADGDKTNDTEARERQLEAVELAAEAEALQNHKV